MRLLFVSIFLIFLITSAKAQTEQEEKKLKDSLYIEDVENKRNPDKVLHAEPLYIDLIRDLGARKGEKEWNESLGLAIYQSSNSSKDTTSVVFLEEFF